jgi:hypothetical protein
MKRVHTGKELEVRQVEKGCLNCDSNVTQVESAQFDSTRVVKVNLRKTNHHKTRPYCTVFCVA